MQHTRKIHPLVKWAFSLYLLIFIPSYWMAYGPENFLWISDIALFFLYAAILFESKVIASMAIVGDIVYALAWVIDFFYSLFAPSPGFTEYVLSSAHPLGVRLLALFHIALPPLMLWAISRLGYDSHAWRYQLIISTALFIFTWFVSSPQKNINIVFGYRYIGWEPFPYLVLLSLVNGVFIFLTHVTIKWFIRKKLL